MLQRLSKGNACEKRALWALEKHARSDSDAAEAQETQTESA